jgi:hypothetical protein
VVKKFGYFSARLGHEISDKLNPCPTTNSNLLDSESVVAR